MGNFVAHECTFLMWMSGLVWASWGYVICPYCDPNHVTFPNLEEAMRGYDVPTGDPNSAGVGSDPGIRNQIFVPMYRNPDGHYRLNVAFVTANTQIKCDATWYSRLYDNYHDYVRGKTDTSTTGFGIEIVPDIEVSTDNEAKENFKANFPALFSRAWSNDQSVGRVLDFFVKERGSIVTSEAVCLTHKVDIADRSRKFFVEPFVEGVKALLEARTKRERLREFKRFVNEFGTHYASSTEMGTKIVIERRYSNLDFFLNKLINVVSICIRYTSRERRSATSEELKQCTVLSGARALGFQSELSHFNCSRPDLERSEMDTNIVERMSIATFGSFIAPTLVDWSKQVVSLVQENAFSPRPIRRELRSIVHLFEARNFEGVNDTSPMTRWFSEMINDYCNIFQLDERVCNASTTGCGLDDTCTRGQEICNDVRHDDAQHVGFVCLPLNVTTTTMTTMMTTRPTTLMHSNGRVGFIGGLDVDGLKTGEGQVFFDDGNKAFEGHFEAGKMNGRGTLYYSDDQPLYRGNLSQNLFLEGEVFDVDGKVVASIRNVTNF